MRFETIERLAESLSSEERRRIANEYAYKQVYGLFDQFVKRARKAYSPALGERFAKFQSVYTKGGCIGDIDHWDVAFLSFNLKIKNPILPGFKGVTFTLPVIPTVLLEEHPLARYYLVAPDGVLYYANPGKQGIVVFNDNIRLPASEEWKPLIGFAPAVCFFSSGQVINVSSEHELEIKYFRCGHPETSDYSSLYRNLRTTVENPQNFDMVMRKVPSSFYHIAGWDSGIEPVPASLR